MKLLTLIYNGSGQVTNVVDFGVFVDIGLGRDQYGLLHTSRMKGRPSQSFAVGARIAVRVFKVEAAKPGVKPRISLELDLEIVE